VLSAGWKQRLALGGAVVHEPRILFLDEPTSGVDPLSRRAFWELIYTVAGEGVTVFVTTHVMDEAEHCDRLGMIYGGRLVALGSLRARRDDAGGGLLEVRAGAADARSRRPPAFPASRSRSSAWPFTEHRPSPRLRAARRARARACASTDRADPSDARASSSAGRAPTGPEPGPRERRR
jgi:ABC-type multidrug transport system ATPase subunit